METLTFSNLLSSTPTARVWNKKWWRTVSHRNDSCYLRLFKRQYRRWAWETYGSLPPLNLVWFHAPLFHKFWKTDCQLSQSNGLWHVSNREGGFKNHPIRLTKNLLGSTLPVGASRIFENLWSVMKGSIHRDALLASTAADAVSAFKKKKSALPFRVPEDSEETANFIGLHPSGLEVETHDHPIHKNVEYLILNVVLPALIFGPLTVLCMKIDKIKRHFPKSKYPGLQFQNGYITVRDRSRFVAAAGYGIIETPYAFIQDQLQNADFNFIGNLFSISPALHTVYATIVLAPCALFDLPSHLEKMFKSFKQDDEFVYELEGERDVRYVQTAQGLDWLRVRRIICSSFVVKVELIQTYGSIHFFAFTRQQATVEEKRRYFSYFDCVELPIGQSKKNDLKYRLVPRKASEALFKYVRALRTLKDVDIEAAIRVEASKPEYKWVNARAWHRMTDVLRQTYDKRVKIEYNWASAWWVSWRADFVIAHMDLCWWLVYLVKVLQKCCVLYVLWLLWSIIPAPCPHHDHLVLLRGDHRVVRAIHYYLEGTRMQGWLEVFPLRYIDRTHIARLIYANRESYLQGWTRVVRNAGMRMLPAVLRVGCGYKNSAWYGEILCALMRMEWLYFYILFCLVPINYGFVSCYDSFLSMYAQMRENELIESKLLPQQWRLFVDLVDFKAGKSEFVSNAHTSLPVYPEDDESDSDSSGSSDSSDSESEYPQSEPESDEDSKPVASGERIEKDESMDEGDIDEDGEPMEEDESLSDSSTTPSHQRPALPSRSSTRKSLAKVTRPAKAKMEDEFDNESDF